MLKILLISILGLQSFFTLLPALESNNKKEKVLERLHQLSEAVNQNDVNAVSSFWTKDAEFIVPLTGEEIEGKEKIAQYLQKRMKELKDRQLKFVFHLKTIDFPERDVVIVQGIADILGKDGLIQRNARKIELIEESGQWYIDSVSEVELPPPPPLYEHLKELEWLVGSWKDKDKNVVISFTTYWDKYKNFLIQRFAMEVYGVTAMEGMQIIGWDSIEKTIHSWVYDSDGGYGIGLWKKKGDSWQVKMNYTLSDGTKGSATNIYTKINDTNYSFSSVDRIIDGQALPNIEPVTVVKEE